jgi:hypothetical protein
VRGRAKGCSGGLAPALGKRNAKDAAVFGDDAVDHAAAILLLAPCGTNPIRTRKVWKLVKMSDQERWLNEILDILGLLRDTAYRDYTRELAERGASLEQIYGTLRSRMNARLS